MTRSLLTTKDETAAAEVGRGDVKVTCARVEGGKQQRGSVSITVPNSTPQEMLAGLREDCDLAAQLRSIAEQSGQSTDQLLAHLQNEFAPAEDAAA